MSPRSEQNQPLQTSVQRRRIRRLVAWFDRHARDLPWRRDRNGYAALVAEAMLLQTQVSRVVDRYERFMQRFPTVQQLAAANEQDVLAAWQGLGYYRRAINLHEAAKVVVEQFAGRVPERAADAAPPSRRRAIHRWSNRLDRVRATASRSSTGT